MVYLERIISITYLYVKIMNRIKGKKHFPRLKKKKKKPTAEWLHIHF